MQAHMCWMGEDYSMLARCVYASVRMKIFSAGVG
jgi:hypothetical protein